MSEKQLSKQTNRSSFHLTSVTFQPESDLPEDHSESERALWTATRWSEQSAEKNDQKEIIEEIERAFMLYDIQATKWNNYWIIISDDFYSNFLFSVKNFQVSFREVGSWVTSVAQYVCPVQYSSWGYLFDIWPIAATRYWPSEDCNPFIRALQTIWHCKY